MSSDIRVSDIEHASDLGYQTSDIAYWISDIRFRTYEITHRTSAIGQRTSDIGVWASDVKYQAWDVFLSQSFVFSASWFKMGPSLCFGSIFKSFWTAITYVRNNLSQIIVSTETEATFSEKKNIILVRFRPQLAWDVCSYRRYLAGTLSSLTVRRAAPQHDWSTFSAVLCNSARHDKGWDIGLSLLSSNPTRANLSTKMEGNTNFKI